MGSSLDVLTQILWNKEVTEGFKPTRGAWKQIKLGRNGPGLSHLFFVDDFILFVEADLDKLSIIREVMEDFFIASGQRVSVAKTQILFSRNCQPSLGSMLPQLFGFEKVTDLDKYLGVPLFHKRVTKTTFAYLLDRISARLSEWVARTLSLVGRITLAKFVLQAIPIYVMQSSWIPKGMCEEMEKLIQKFVCGSCNGGSGMALVKRDITRLPMEHGGLGFKNLFQKNKAFLMKIGYQLVMNKESLWVQVLISKFDWSKQLPISLQRANSSWLWKDGFNTDFWYDHWLGPVKRLAFLCTASVPSSPVTICDMVDNYGNWDWSRLSLLLPQAMLDRVVAIPPPSVALGQDRPGWPSLKNQSFSLVAVDGRLLTNVEWKRHHLVDSNVCSLCHGRSETLIHVLRDCSMAQLVWRAVIKHDKLRFFVHCHLTIGDFLLFCERLAREYVAEFHKSHLSVSRTNRAYSHWTKTLVGWIKASSDSWVATGGVIRDAYGGWISGCARSIGRCSVLMAQLWASHDILLAAWDMGFRQVQLETDNSEVDLIVQGHFVALGGCSLLDSILLLLACPCSVCIFHIPRSQNLVADRVVALCHGSSFVSMIFNLVHVELAELVYKEATVG
ncbi:hypothetical protein GQ457_15G019500 [Hibiscus cannabinus]